MVQHLVLPGDDLLGGDIAHLQLAKVGEQLGADNVFLSTALLWLALSRHGKTV